MSGSRAVTAAQWKRLTAAARKARRRAYAPYSRFAVGAAVLDQLGRIHAACNVENASYGLTICAERAAVFAAVAGGARRLRAVAIVAGRTDPVPPCGACRQVLAEFSRDIPVRMISASGRTRTAALADLLPSGFGRRRS